MENTRFIMLEGLPGTGKSTNSSFLTMQLQRKGKEVKWIHEVARPHPFAVFKEANLTFGEYDSVGTTYPHAKPVLDRIATFRKNTVGIDLLQLDWNHQNEIGMEAFRTLQKYDGWNISLDRYVAIALEKWTYFTEKALENENGIYLLDGSLLQYPIFTFLLKNAPYKDLERFVLRLIQIVQPLHPNLIYFYRENTCDAIDFLKKLRGKQFMEAIWERDKAEPYYKDKPTGAEGHICFLRDYAESAKRLFDAADCRKKSIEISKQHWESYETEMLSFLKVGRRSYPDALPPNGVFRNETLGQEITVSGCLMKDPNGSPRALTPKSDFEFYVECLPVVLRFCGENQIVIAGEQICEQWTSGGTLFTRI